MICPHCGFDTETEHHPVCVRLRQYWEDSGKNQTVIANQFGMTQATFSRYVTFNAVPNKGTRQLIEKVLDDK